MYQSSQNRKARRRRRQRWQAVCGAVQDSLKKMTADELGQFLNVYALVVSDDPDADRMIKTASVKQLLSGQLLSGEHPDAANSASDGPEPSYREVVDHSAEDDDDDDNDDDDNDDVECALSGARDHIEKCKQRLQPMLSIIDELMGRQEQSRNVFE